MPTLGLGFILSSAYRGLERGFDAARSGFNDINNLLRGLNETAGSSTFGNFLSALNFGKLSSIKDQIGGFIGMDQDVSRLTSSLEGTRVSLNETMSQMGAGLDISGKELKKWESTIFSAVTATNTEMNSATESFRILKQQGLDLAKIGIPSFQAFLKSMKVTKMEGDKFLLTVSELSNLGVKDGMMKGLLDDFAAISKRSNLGAEGVGSIIEQVNTLSPILTQTFQREGPEAVAKMLRSTQMLAGVMQQAIGGEASKNMQAALELTKTMAQTKLDFSGMFAGLNSEMPELMKQIMQNLGTKDIGTTQEALDSLFQSDPFTFMKKMREFSDTAKSMGSEAQKVFAERMVRQIASVSPGLAELMTHLGDVNNVFEKMGNPNGPIAGATGQFDKMTDAGFKTGRTLSDTVQLQMQLFEQKVRDIQGNKIDRVFTRQVIPSLNQFGSRLVSLSKDKGPMGYFVRRLSEAQKIGLAAFLPLDEEEYGKPLADIGKKLFIYGQVVGMTNNVTKPFMDSMMKIAIVLPFLTSGFTRLGKILGILIASPFKIIGGFFGGILRTIPFIGPAIASVGGALMSLITGPLVILPIAMAGLLAVFALGTERGGKFAKMLENIVGKISIFLSNIVNNAAMWLENFVKSLSSGEKATADGIVLIFKKGFQRVADIFAKTKILRVAFARLGDVLWQLLKYAFNRAWEMLAEINWKDKISNVLSGMLTATTLALSEFWVDFKGLFTQSIADDFGTGTFDFGAMGKNIRKSLDETFRSILDIDWGSVADAVLDSLDNMALWIYEGIEKSLSFLDDIDIGGWLIGLGDKLSGAGDMIIDLVYGMFAGSGESVGGGLAEALKSINWSKLWEIVKGIITVVINGILGLNEIIGKVVKGLLVGLSGLLWGLLKLIGKLIFSLGIIIYEWLVAALKIDAAMLEVFIVKPFMTILDKVKSIFGSMFEIIKNDFWAIMDVVMVPVNFIIEKFQAVWDFLYGLFGHSVHTLIKNDFDQILGVVQPILDAFANAFDIVFGTIKTIVTEASDIIGSVISTVIDLGRIVMEGIASAIRSAIDKLSSGFTLIKTIVTSLAKNFNIDLSSDKDEQNDKSPREQQERQAARQEKLVNRDKDMMELMVGVLRRGFDVLHTDNVMLLNKKQEHITVMPNKQTKTTTNRDYAGALAAGGK